MFQTDCPSAGEARIVDIFGMDADQAAEAGLRIQHLGQVHQPYVQG